MTPDESGKAFKEAFDYLDEAIRLESQNNRIAIHPYTTLFKGVANYLQQSSTLSPKQNETLKAHISNAQQLFRYDRQLLEAASKLNELIQPQL